MLIDLYNDDCFNVFKDIESNSIDAIICDPPYNISYDGNSWDSNFDICSALDECCRILKVDGNLILFQGWSNVCSTKEYLDKHCKDLICQDWIIYDRIKGRGGKKHLVSTREDILWYSKGINYTFNKIPSTIKKKTGGLGLKNGCEFRALSNVWTDISPIVPWSKEHVNHPTQKPLQLMKRCVELWSNESDIILDFCMGSGTTGVACRELNRNFVGVEADLSYFKIANERINMCFNNCYSTTADLIDKVKQRNDVHKFF